MPYYCIDQIIHSVYRLTEQGKFFDLPDYSLSLYDMLSAPIKSNLVKTALKIKPENYDELIEKYLENNEGPENYFEMSLKILENMKEIVQNKFKTMGNQIQLFIQDCEIDDFFQFDKFVNLADEFDQDEHKKNVMNDLQNMPNLDGFSEEELHQFLLDRLNGENKMPLINYMMKKVDPRIESLKEFLLETTFKALIEKCK